MRLDPGSGARHNLQNQLHLRRVGQPFYWKRDLIPEKNLNEKINDAASYKLCPFYSDDLITSKTKLNVKEYGDAPLDFVKRLGIPEKEWRRTGKVYVLRSCILHHWITNRSTYPARWAEYLEFIKRILQTVAN